MAAPPIESEAANSDRNLPIVLEGLPRDHPSKMRGLAARCPIFPSLGCLEQQLVIVCDIDGGAIATTALRSTRDEHGPRFVKAFLDTLGYDDVDLKRGRWPRR